MTQAPLYDMDGTLLRQVDLPDDVFGIDPNRAVMHQARSAGTLAAAALF